MTVPAPLPPNERQRLACLESFGVLDTEPEQLFDDLTLLAANICEAPIALVSLVDPNRQWFKSTFGIEAKETCRDIAFCAHTILENRLMIVEDATKDRRFRNNPLVTGEPGIRFYAGAPLSTPDHFNLGTLCVIDRVPRSLSEDQQNALQILSRQVVAQLMLRKSMQRMADRVVESESFRVLAEHSSDAHLLIDPERGIVDCNPASVKLFQCDSKSRLLSIHPMILAPEYQPDGQLSTDQYQAMVRLARENATCSFEWMFCGVGGNEFPGKVTLQPVTFNGNDLMLGVVHDLTEQKQAAERLLKYQRRLEHAYAKLKEHIATDQLTGVCTRNSLDKRLGEEFDRASRFERPLSVIVTDIDHFREFNDLFGYAEGDRVLCQVADQISKNVRPTDLVARCTGERFAIVLPETNDETAMSVAENLRRAIADYPWKQRHVTLSLGVATLQTHHAEPSSLISDSYRAMDESKSKGRDCVSLYGESTVCEIADQ